MGVGAPKASPSPRAPSFAIWSHRVSYRRGAIMPSRASPVGSLRRRRASSQNSDLARVLAACDGEDRLRDRAVILLLARLGLRASEVAHLSFEQIDWADGRLTVAGKVRREDRLPLTQEVGDAIIAYIERARPRVATARVFLTDAAPIVPLSRVTVKCIVRRALSRAGVDSPHRGAHVLRHSAATAMLRHGVSLAGVGAVLRHRSPSMTALYAKVDITLLSEIAQPWGGRLPC